MSVITWMSSCKSASMEMAISQRSFTALSPASSCYLQGGLNFAASRAGVLLAIQKAYFKD